MMTRRNDPPQTSEQTTLEQQVESLRRDIRKLQITVLLADGLGHGTFANHAATQAARSLEANGNAPIKEIVHCAHAVLRSTVGACVGVARVPMVSSITHPALTFAGIGNISASVWTEPSHKHLPSHDGVVGHPSSLRCFTAASRGSMTM
ncbi:hypothetical protein AWB75_05518 [Caballeronia catudaia]|uniref:Uncharacterized protein n=1 Tax=Caballeronia catudaia TaxID=1777136 RepID=A0A158CRM3_9BURK|nr:hypothetical protein AWB75_05518 [Caballeronia catudaia]